MSRRSEATSAHTRRCIVGWDGRKKYFGGGAIADLRVITRALTAGGIADRRVVAAA